MFEVQKLFNSTRTDEMPHGSLANFAKELAKIGVDIRDYPDHNMMLLDYNMIECDKNHPVVLECRGLLMDYSGNIVRKGFNRFFNLGENGVDTFDFENSIAFEKADGSLCLSENTIVHTNKGNKTIKELCDAKFSGKVMAFNHTTNTVEFADVCGHLITENKDTWVEIELENGTKLIATEDHRVWSESRKAYVRVSELDVNELMLVL